MNKNNNEKFTEIQKKKHFGQTSYFSLYFNSDVTLSVQNTKINFFSSTIT